MDAFCMDRELIVDSFAGGGGASLGIHLATGRSPDIAINHDAAAIAMHEVNHPDTLHCHEDVWKVNPRSVTQGRPVGLLWASPDCKHFSRAKGSKPVSKSIRSLAWVVVRWAAEVTPRIIILENVPEFEDWGPLVGNMPDKTRKGLTFRRFVGRLKALGYVVEWKKLNAAEYGAPTNRRRLFLVARCDGESIVWPEPTHGDPKRSNDLPLFGRLKPWATAADCIDWSMPCPSIFNRKRPLAEKTMRRIALGIRRYVLEAAEPFIVNIERAGDAFRGQAINNPLGTITAGPKGGKHALVAACLAKHYGGVVGQELTRPLGTVTAVDHHSLTAAHLVKFRGDSLGHPVTDPVPTITSGAGSARPAGAAHALGIAATCLARFNHGDKQWNSVAEPLGTITSQGNKFGLVYAFLVKYFGTAIGASLTEPLHTVTGKHRFGLVTVEVSPGQHEPAVAVDVPGMGLHVIADIGLRMLTPRELARAQGFPDSYVLTGTKSSQVARIGNSVCPPIAQAMVAANYSDEPALVGKVG